MALTASGSRINCCIVLFACLFSIFIIGVAFTLFYFSDSTITGDGLRAVPTLKFVVVVSRHGNRRLGEYPNDPYPVNNTSLWPYGLEELTSSGRGEMYNLGMKIRSLYNGYLKQYYFSEELYSSSTAIGRVIMSGEAFLAGLYPPKGFQVWNEDINWQPIPLYSNSLDKTVDGQYDCPRYLYLQNCSSNNFTTKYSSNLTAINTYLSQYAGANLTGMIGFFSVWDSLISEEAEGFALPEWSKPVYPQIMNTLAAQMFIYHFAGTVDITRLLIGSFYAEMLNAMTSKANGTLTPDHKMYYYSGHDSSIVALQIVLGIPQSSVMGVIYPGSAMIFELHQDPNSHKFTVQVLYIDASSKSLDLKSLQIPGCQDSCDFDQLIQNTQRFLVLNDNEYKQECQLNFTRSTEKHES